MKLFPDKRKSQGEESEMRVFRWLLIFYGIMFSFLSPLLSQEDEIYAQRRKNMVQKQLAARDITEKKILEVMGSVPRHLFVGSRYQRRAYEDHPLPIDEGQTISQPYIVALMTQHLKLKEGEKVLEIGTGSGYQAAVLAHLTDKVYSVEIREGLADRAAQTLKKLNYSQVRVKWGDGYFGWEEHAPFDAIIVTCAANHIPPPLIEQLKDGGRLIVPVGSTLYYQTLTLLTKVGEELRVEHKRQVSILLPLRKGQDYIHPRKRSTVQIPN